MFLAIAAIKLDRDVARLADLQPWVKLTRLSDGME